MTLRKLEQRIVKAAMSRYAEWLGEAPNWNPLNSTKTLVNLVEACRLYAAALKAGRGKK